MASMDNQFMIKMMIKMIVKMKIKLAIWQKWLIFFKNYNSDKSILTETTLKVLFKIVCG